MNCLFWIDLEMTGLNPEVHRIVEAALVVTDMKFEVLAQYDTVVFQDAQTLQEMDPWCVQHHGSSGLTAQIPQGEQEGNVEKKLIEFAQKFSPTQKIVLAGNTIGQDRKFIDRWMPEFSALLHYRMLDVSSFKIVFDQIFHKRFKKQKKHRAVDDILESIAELKHYTQFIKDRY